MKNYLLTILILLMTIGSYSAFAENSEQQLREKIASLDSTNLKLRKKKDILANRLELIECYRVLDTILVDLNIQKEVQLVNCNPYKDITSLLSDGIDAFSQEIPADVQIPNSLKYHYETISLIRALKERIELTEQKVVQLSENYAQEVLKSGQVKNIKSIIGVEIENDMDYMNELIQKIKKRDLTSLSTQQYQYFKPGLTDRYNKFIKFFE